jgi:hypothetical protein
VSPSQDTEAKVSCCCDKAAAPKDSPTDPEDREQQESAKDEFERSNSDPRFSQVSPIRRFNSSDSVTTCETGSSGSIRKFNSCEQLRSSDCFAGGYNRARVTEINDEEDEVVDEINEPVFVDIPTLVAVLIKPDDSLHESSARIEEICADEVQEDSIDADFGIEAGNEEYDESTTKLDDDNRSNSTNSCNVPDDQEINEVSPECSRSFAEGDKSRGEFIKQDSVDLSSSNLNVSRKFGSIDGISKSREPVVGLQRSQTNLERRPALAERAKKLNNIREIDDRKASGKSATWRSIGNKDHLQRKSSNESDKSAKDSNSGKATSIGRRPSLESLKRKTSKDSSSSSSKDEQILISSLTRDKFLRRKSSLEHEAAGARQHTAIQRVKRAEIVAAVTERLYSSRKHTEENNMASNSASGMRSPPEGIDVKLTNSSSSGLTARSRLQEISRKMLLRRRRINVDTQTETASTLRLRDAATLTEESRVVLQDAAMLTDDHEDCAINRNALVAEADVADHRLPVLRVKDVATLTDRRPRADIFRCKDAETLANDLEFDEYEMQSRNDPGVLSDDATRNYIESSPSSIAIPQQFCHVEGDRRVLCVDSSTNTFLTSSVRNSAVQTTRPEVDQWKASSENRGCARCCNMTHKTGQSAPENSSSERNVISISLPDMISITIESANGLESRIAMMDGADVAEEKPKLVFNDKESQTDEHIDSEAERSPLMNLALRSTATQADGRVFRIENIFEDPKSRNYREMTSDPRRKIATKKSVTFRNSLGTSSIIGARETEVEWNGGHVDDTYHRKRAILKGGLTRAFIAKKRSCSLSPRRPAHRLVRHDLWRNWTLPRPGKSPGLVDLETKTSSGEGNSNSANNLSPRMSGECISADEVAKKPTNELSSAPRTSRSDSRRTKASTKSLLTHEHNFSDDSLDDDENEIEDHRSADANLRDRESHESLCPPDVVAHTKRETSKSANHENLAKFESSMDDDYDDIEVEFPKTKSIEISNNDPLRDYEALILETSSYIVDSVDSEEETNAITTSGISKKKVSFSNSSNPERITVIPTSRQDSEIVLKSIIKKIMKPAATESLDIVQQRNVEIDQSLQRRKMESTKSEEISLAKRENQDSVDPGKPFDDKMVEFPNEDRSESCGRMDDVVDGTSCSHSLPTRKNILEEYLNEATTFMRNMNSINEYMSATSVLENYGKRRRKRNSRRGNHLRADKNSAECRGRRAGPRDDEVDPCHSRKNGIAAESYEKCLRSIERLESCIDKVNRHNQVLRDRYGIDVESTGAKLSLAYPSVDSKMPVVIDDGAIDTGSEDRSDEPRIFCSSSVRDDDARRFAPNETDSRETLCRTGERDGGVTAEDDLERRIFDQLMRAADSSCESYRSLTESQRERHLWKGELRSRSPTTYCKFQATCRRYGRGILNFDQVPATADYLGDIREIENSRPSLRQMRQAGISAIDSERFRDEVLRKNDNSVETKVPREPAIFKARTEHVDLADSVRSIETSFAEEETARGDTQGSKDGLRVESMNLRFGGPLSVELKYPGSPRAKFLELLKERRRIVENSRGTNAF